MNMHTQHSEDKNSVLIIGPSWVGDMVMAQTLFKLLKQQTPQRSIDVLAPAWSEPLLARMPEIRRSIPLAINHGELKLSVRKSVAHTLRATQYEQAIVLPNSWKSALIPWWANIPKRTGWLGEFRWGLLNDARRLDKIIYPLMIQRFAALAYPAKTALPTALPYPQLHTEKQNGMVACAQFELTTDKPVLALCPGAEYGPAKRWPTEYFANVANHALHNGWDVWLFGSPKDDFLGAEIQTGTQQRCKNLIGKTSLAQAIDLLALTECVITNDSGLMHIACALNKKVIALYGSSDPRFTPPLSDHVQILSLKLPCSPCFERTCPLQHFQCMLDLKPEQIITKFEEYAACVS